VNEYLHTIKCCMRNESARSLSVPQRHRNPSDKRLCPSVFATQQLTNFCPRGTISNSFVTLCYNISTRHRRASKLGTSKLSYVTKHTGVCTCVTADSRVSHYLSRYSVVHSCVAGNNFPEEAATKFDVMRINDKYRCDM
jgi:hypothetical protein